MCCCTVPVAFENSDAILTTDPVCVTCLLSGRSPDLFGPTLLKVHSDVPWSGLVFRPLYWA